MASSRAAPKTRQWRAAGAPPHPLRRGASAPQGRWLWRPSSVARTGFSRGMQKSTARWPRGTLSRAARSTFTRSLTGQRRRTPPATFRAPGTPAPIGEGLARFAASMPRPTRRGIIVPVGWQGKARPRRGRGGGLCQGMLARIPVVSQSVGAGPRQQAGRAGNAARGRALRRHRTLTSGGRMPQLMAERRAPALAAGYQESRRPRRGGKTGGARAAAGRETLRVGAAASLKRARVPELPWDGSGRRARRKPPVPWPPPPCKAAARHARGRSASRGAPLPGSPSASCGSGPRFARRRPAGPLRGGAGVVRAMAGGPQGPAGPRASPRRRMTK